MGQREIAQLEHELMLLTRHPAMGAFGSGWNSGDQRLERSAYLLMSRIEQTGPMSIGQLSDAFQVNTSTVNRQTAAMLRAGLVERIPDPGGGMARKFQLSAYGGERLDRHRSWSLRGLRNVLADWEADEVDDLVRSLTHLNESIQRRQRQRQLRDTS